MARPVEVVTRQEGISRQKWQQEPAESREKQFHLYPVGEALPPNILKEKASVWAMLPKGKPVDFLAVVLDDG
jgi:hypothetical protein